MSQDRTETTRMICRPSDGESLPPAGPHDADIVDESEAEISEFSEAISAFFSGKLLSDMRDTFSSETPDRGPIDTNFNPEAVASPHFAHLDNLGDEPASTAGTDTILESDEARISPRGPFGGPNRTSPTLDEQSAVGFPREIEGLIVRNASGEMTPSHASSGSPEFASSPGLASIDFWQAGTQTKSRFRPESGEDLSVSISRDAGLVARQSVIESGGSGWNGDRPNPRFAENKGLDDEFERKASARTSSEMKSPNRSNFGQIEIPPGRMIANPDEFSPRDIPPTRPAQTGVGPAADTRGVESTWPGGMQADLQRMSELLETLVAEAVRGRLGGMPGPASRPHSLR